MIKNQNNIVASIIACFFSKFNTKDYKKALDCLGYKNEAEAFFDLSKRLNLNSKNYIKLRRDEFDPFFDNGRIGFINRKVSPCVKQIFNEFNELSFLNFAKKIEDLLEIGSAINLSYKENSDLNELLNLSELELESILNFQDDNSRIIKKLSEKNLRIINNNKINKLKEYYGFKCQICGEEHHNKYGCNIIEAHHIDFFSKSYNNNSYNIIILCPNHHRIIHQALPSFDRGNKRFIYKNGLIEELKINHHL